MVYPKELAYDDFAMARAAKAGVVEVDRFRHGYFQIPPLHSAHFLFVKYIIHWSGAINGLKLSCTNICQLICVDIPEDSPPGF